MRDHLTKLREEHGEITIYSGGANGIDQFWMEVGHYLGIQVVAILPFPSFDKLWPESGRKHLRELLDRCQEVRYTHTDAEITDKATAVQAMMDRDLDLVNACDELVAYWNGTKGGTAHTVGFAQKAGKPVSIFNPDEIS
jgi:nucleoside 2-deoxyribosyltransferase